MIAKNQLVKTVKCYENEVQVCRIMKDKTSMQRKLRKKSAARQISEKSIQLVLSLPITTLSTYFEVGKNA